MKGLSRRLAVLEKSLAHPAIEEEIVEVALNTGQGDFAFNGREWLPCPNGAELLARRDLPITFYSGMSLAMLIGPTGRPAREGNERLDGPRPG